MSFRHTRWNVEPREADPPTEAELEPAGAFLDRLLGAGRWSVSGHRIFADVYNPADTVVVDRCVPLGRNVTVVTGTHGSGIRMAPGIAQVVADDLVAGLGLPTSPAVPCEEAP